MLAGHPEILAWPPFEQEPRVVTYWIEVLRALARPDSFMRQVAPAGNLNGDWWLGRRDPRPRALGDTDIQAWLAGEAVEELAAFAQTRIESLYGRLAARDGRERRRLLRGEAAQRHRLGPGLGAVSRRRARSCSCAIRATCCAPCWRRT